VGHPSASVDDWPTVVTSVFAPATPDPELEDAAVQFLDHLAVELGRYRDVRVVPRRELLLPGVSPCDDSRFALSGRFSRDGEDLRLVARLVDRHTGARCGRRSTGADALRGGRSRRRPRASSPRTSPPSRARWRGCSGRSGGRGLPPSSRPTAESSPGAHPQSARHPRGPSRPLAGPPAPRGDGRGLPGGGAVPRPHLIPAGHGAGLLPRTPREARGGAGRRSRLLRTKPDFARRGRTLIGRILKPLELQVLVADGLAKAGLALD
jgi:hypothetical protein